MEGRTRSGKSKAWWPTLLREAAGSFDFAVVHTYTKSGIGPDERNPEFKLSKRIRRLKKYISGHSDNPILIALTEWNTPKERVDGRTTEIEHLMEIAIQLGGFAVGGVDFAHYWPMRTPTDGFRAAFDQMGQPTAVGQLFRETRGLLDNALVSQRMAESGVYLLATKTSTVKGFMIVNLSEHDIEARLPPAAHRLIDVKQFRSDNQGDVSPPVSCEAELAADDYGWLNLPSRSITIIIRSRSQQPD
jgi:hypothetical protein